LKKPLLILAYLLFFVTALSAQNAVTFNTEKILDTNIRGVMIKINPIATVSWVAGGDIGGTLQKPVSGNLDIFVGLGYNTNTNGWGYTIRAGTCFFFSKTKYFSFQLFYRRWQLTNVDVYIIHNGVGYNGTNNSIIDPVKEFQLSFFNSSSPNSLENAQANILDISAIWGWRFYVSKHFLWEIYTGVGLRVKGFMYEEIGTYDYTYASPIYTPLSEPISSNNTFVYPEIKFGVLFGYMFKK
jgi:hypothetical protein